jgi:hypothetical protein
MEDHLKIKRKPIPRWLVALIFGISLAACLAQYSMQTANNLNDVTYKFIFNVVFYSLAFSFADWVVRKLRGRA